LRSASFAGQKSSRYERTAASPPVHREQVARALTGADREAGAAQHPEMVRGRLLREADLLGDCADRAWGRPDHPQDRSPVPVRKRT